jgi:predicted DNA-binding transcriptional regulator YafY
LQHDFIITVMNKSEKACIKNRIIKLAGLRCTGTPADLAAKFEMSDRSVKRIIREMREEGCMIEYDYASISYIIVDS